MKRQQQEKRVVFCYSLRQGVFMKCPHCGFEDEGNFCSNCGKPLVSKETSVSTKLEASIKLGLENPLQQIMAM